MKATIKQWRGLRGLSQPALGEKIGKTANTILNWEKGYTSPTVDDMKALRQALGLKANDHIIMQ
jgi:transcriptional regulator with XRE-family HTH domain